MASRFTNEIDKAEEIADAFLNDLDAKNQRRERKPGRALKTKLLGTPPISAVRINHRPEKANTKERSADRAFKTQAAAGSSDYHRS